MKTKQKKKPVGEKYFQLKVQPETIRLKFNPIEVSKHGTDEKEFYRALYTRVSVVGSGMTVVDSLRTIEMYLHGELLSLRVKIDELENQK